MRGKNIFEQVNDIVEKEKTLNESKKDLIKPLNVEIQLNLQEISEELKREFGLHDYLKAVSSATVELSHLTENGAIKYQNLELEFDIQGRKYWVGEYVCHLISIYTEPR